MIFTNSYRWSNTHFFLRLQRLFHCSGRTSGKPNAAQPMTVADKCPKWRAALVAVAAVACHAALAPWSTVWWFIIPLIQSR